jgi:hypothetical protein
MYSKQSCCYKYDEPEKLSEIVKDVSKHSEALKSVQYALRKIVMRKAWFLCL